MAGSFMGGAKNRLLPASVPFSFFLAAAGFQVLAWAVLFYGAGDLAGFRGGTGPVLAAIHLLTLGVLALTAMGASYQLFPVVTRQPLARTWPARASFWIVTPGILVLSFGMAVAHQPAMVAGGGLVIAGLGLFALLTAHNLGRARSLPVVAAHGWGAMVALLGAAGIGAALIGDFDLGMLADRAGYAQAHMILASFGFMGLLVLGLSQILIPMFILSHSLPVAAGWTQLGLTLAALALYLAGLALGNAALSAAALASGVGAAVAHFWLMRAAFRNRMSRRLGLSFVLIRASWRFLGLALLIGLAVLLELPLPNGPALFGFVVLAGWLLTFLTGVLQRIMPFLASMHASGHSGLPPLMSSLTAHGPLKLHALGHFSALALCALGILLDLTILIQVGAGAGILGALAFAGFAVNVVVRLNQPERNG